MRKQAKERQHRGVDFILRGHVEASAHLLGASQPGRRNAMRFAKASFFVANSSSCNRQLRTDSQLSGDRVNGPSSRPYRASQHGRHHPKIPYAPIVPRSCAAGDPTDRPSATGVGTRDRHRDGGPRAADAPRHRTLQSATPVAAAARRGTPRAADTRPATAHGTERTTVDPYW